MLAFLESFARHFSWYNLFAAVGLCAGLCYALYRLSAAGFGRMECGRVTAATLIAFFCGAGASNLFNWFIFPELLTLPLLTRIRAAGLTFYPGMICAICLCLLLWKLLGLPAGRVLSLTVPAFPLFHAVARIGCAITGCCYGRELCLAGKCFRFPYPLFESAALLALFLILHLARPRRPALVYFTAYPIFRFFAEFLRGDRRGTLIPGCPLSVSQQISLAILAGVFVYALIAHFRAHTVTGKDGNHT